MVPHNKENKMKYTHKIMYQGAPYGDGEAGHTVSRHKSRELAEKAFQKRFGGSPSSYDHKIVAIEDDGAASGSPTTRIKETK